MCRTLLAAAGRSRKETSARCKGGSAAQPRPRRSRRRHGLQDGISRGCQVSGTAFQALALAPSPTDDVPEPWFLLSCSPREKRSCSLHGLDPLGIRAFPSQARGEHCPPSLFSKLVNSLAEVPWATFLLSLPGLPLATILLPSLAVFFFLPCLVSSVLVLNLLEGSFHSYFLGHPHFASLLPRRCEFRVPFLP